MDYRLLEHSPDGAAIGGGSSRRISQLREKCAVKHPRQRHDGKDPKGGLWDSSKKVPTPASLLTDASGDLSGAPAYTGQQLVDVPLLASGAACSRCRSTGSRIFFASPYSDCQAHRTALDAAQITSGSKVPYQPLALGYAVCLSLAAGLRHCQRQIRRADASHQPSGLNVPKVRDPDAVCRRKISIGWPAALS
jgi:hypothetical protein